MFNPIFAFKLGMTLGRVARLITWLKLNGIEDVDGKHVGKLIAEGYDDETILTFMKLKR